MNIKIKAAIETAKTVTVLTLLAIIVPIVIHLISIQMLASIITVGCIYFGVKMIYDIKLSEAERDSIVNIDKE